MSLQLIIKSVQDTNSSNEKLAILQDHVSNEELKWYLTNSQCKSISFYIGSKTYPLYQPTGENKDLLDSSVLEVIERIKNRVVTGSTAIEELAQVQNTLDGVSAELLKGLILQDPKTKVGAKALNKIWPKLLVDIPYQRCSLPDEKFISRVNTSDEVIVQLKGDGIFGVLVNHDGQIDMYTRNGSRFPREFAEIFTLQFATETAIEGEVIWYDGDEPLLREVSNGISNKVAKGGEIPSEYTPRFLVWNVIPFTEWDNHKSPTPYIERLNKLIEIVKIRNSNSAVEIIPTHMVGSMNEAVAINNKYLAEGREGTIIKFPNGLWAYNTSKDMVKLKIEVDIDMEIVSVEEATGKNEGMAGRINVKSSDGKVVCGINCNGTDAERTELWENRDSVVGKVIVVTCNDIMSAAGKTTFSLSLGRANPANIRFDKSEADDISRIKDIFEAIGVTRDIL